MTISKVVSFLFPYSFILFQFTFAGTYNIGFAFFLFLAAMSFLSSRKIFFVKEIFFFSIIVILAVIINYLIWDNLSFGTPFYFINGLLLTLAIFPVANAINEDTFFRSYNFLGLLVTFIVFTQSFYILSTGNSVAPINLLPITEEQSKLWQAAFRPSAIFSEPQYLSTFVTPLIALNMQKNKWVNASILALGVIASGSTYGLFFLIFLIAYNIITNQIFLLNRYRNLVIFGSITLFFLFNSGFAEYGLLKLQSTDLSEDKRLTKSLLIFLNLEYKEFLFGIGTSIENHLLKSYEDFIFLYFQIFSGSHLLGYVTGFFGLGIFFGILPMIYFIFMLIMLYFRGKGFTRLLVVFIFIHSLVATILFNSYFCFLLTLLVLYLRHNEESSLRNISAQK